MKPPSDSSLVVLCRNSQNDNVMIYICPHVNHNLILSCSDDMLAINNLSADVPGKVFISSTV